MAEAGNTLQPAPVFEILERALAGEPLDGRDAVRLIECSDAELPSVMRAAAEMRDRAKAARSLIRAKFSCQLPIFVAIVAPTVPFARTRTIRGPGR